MSRSTVAFCLWPEHTEREARAELRRHFYFLGRWLKRHTTRDDWIDGSRGTLSWSAEAPIDVDVRRLRRAHAIHCARIPVQVVAIEEILPLTAAPLLPDRYASWLEPHRQTLHHQQIELLEAVATASEASHYVPAALRATRRLVELDPLREVSYRRMMLLHAAAGDRAAAMAQYEVCRTALRRELGVDPDAETVALYERLRDTPELDAKRRETVAEPGAVDLPMHQHLPRPLTSFIGRRLEVDKLCELLGDERLVTIVGPGGAGKTRLALAVAEEVASRFQDGVLWLDLSAVGSGEAVTPSVARALPGGPAPSTASQAELGARLSEEELLIVLDNCEHVAHDAAALAQAFLAAAPRLRILATSRLPLELPEELRWSIPPMAVRTATGASKDLETQADAVTLFVDRARRVVPDWTPTAAENATIAGICQGLDALPLAIEISAARVGQLSLEEIAARASDDPRSLGTTRVSTKRLRSLETTFDWSYQLLQAPARDLLRAVATFASAFDDNDATILCTDDVHGVDELIVSVRKALDQLVKASLVVREPDANRRYATMGDDPRDFSSRSRYRLLDTIRPFARERAIAEGEAMRLRRRHWNWITHKLETLVEARQGQELPHLLAEVDGRRAEIEQAMAYLTPAGVEAEALRFGAAAWRYWNVRGDRGRERRWLENLLERTTHNQNAERFTVLLGAGVLAYGAGDLDQAEARCAASVAGFEALDADESANSARVYLALVRHLQGDDKSARALCEKNLARLEASGQRNEAAEIYAILGDIHLRSGELEEARALFQRSLGIQRHIRWQHPGLRNALRGLGAIARHQGRISEASTFYKEGLDLSRALGDSDGEAVWRNELGCLHLEQAELDDAEEHFKAALRIYQARTDRRREAILLHNLGELNLLRGRWSLSRRAFETSLQRGQRPITDPRRIETLLFLVGACTRLGDHRRAGELLSEGSELAGATGDLALHARARREEAILHHVLEDHAKADRHAALALEAAIGAEPLALRAALESALWRLVRHNDHGTAQAVFAALQRAETEAPRPRDPLEQRELEQAAARLRRNAGTVAYGPPSLEEATERAIAALTNDAAQRHVARPSVSPTKPSAS